MSPSKAKLAAPAASLLLLGALITESAFRTSPASAEPYHERVAQAASTFPYQIGSWVGQDTPVPAAATTLLRPNVIISRRFENIQTGHTVNFLLVQCRDSRDMLGHYPPVCYPGSGWTLTESRTRQAVSSDVSRTAMQYEFTRTVSGQLATITVVDFMLLPDGRVVHTMEALRHAARKQDARFFGAAQVQMVFDPSTNDNERNDAIRGILDAAAPLLKEIQSGE